MTQKEENFPESIQLARNDQENIEALNLPISTSTQPPNNLFNYYKQRAEILFYLNKYEGKFRSNTRVIAVCIYILCNGKDKRDPVINQTDQMGIVDTNSVCKSPARNKTIFSDSR
ncbi:unnamed protein product [Rotaria magnacalcarata]|uniref:Uncharacterized protein n=1 Tax=Rotaria magnacalcarata TaxID=392030 RepID=A0A816FGQ0_9BILA|nr:unnamed protein product [Rotaria magnacalcarata]CAF1661390.1 unnamed protein product [Rotaria magnacalcarata]CAF2073611.1 unnamed protein product [Rotaria magnacalcarata]CAF2161853.1 unnamed protein product [Rotaria magnacalcarata]